MPIPPHRMKPIKAAWPKIFPHIVEHLKLQVRMNLKSRAVELRTSKHTTDTGALQKGEDFVKAFRYVELRETSEFASTNSNSLGFDVDDAVWIIGSLFSYPKLHSCFILCTDLLLKFPRAATATPHCSRFHVRKMLTPRSSRLHFFD